ncbi:hypothetical protein CYMTET_9596 [Cymbomonas tetramitiformis]|uniref:Lipid desaturase domain-containing protein n=1 Tax=Cymbomonas tetramitiformis TaxID=36881 RepID=A0AAE0GR63_9CHLO|nr:hypothetical protein CYMTET_9596 [Cymbomonas tetramitiformis]
MSRTMKACTVAPRSLEFKTESLKRAVQLPANCSRSKQICRLPHSSRDVTTRARRGSAHTSGTDLRVCEINDTTGEEECSTIEGYYEPDDLALMDGEMLVGDQLTSTLEHRLIVWGSFLLASGLFFDGYQDISSATLGVEIIAGYVMADLVSGVFHWGVDNYGNEKTPLLGNVIAAFQGHHMYPWTITKREFCNNIHKVAKPTIPALAFMWVLPLPDSLNAFLATLTVLSILSQQFHSWSHCRKSTLSEPVVALQESGVLISRKMHGQHHRVPFESNYCIVSGMWNPVLDQNRFFPWLEKQVCAATGVEPRNWSDPDYAWLKECAQNDPDGVCRVD